MACLAHGPARTRLVGTEVPPSSSSPGPLIHTHAGKPCCKPPVENARYVNPPTSRHTAPARTSSQPPTSTQRTITTSSSFTTLPHRRLLRTPPRHLCLRDSSSRPRQHQLLVDPRHPLLGIVLIQKDKATSFSFCTLDHFHRILSTGLTLRTFGFHFCHAEQWSIDTAFNTTTTIRTSTTVSTTHTRITDR
jgi:hypothetical protein